MARNETLGQAAVMRSAMRELGAKRARRHVQVPIDVLAQVPLFGGLTRRHLRKLSNVIDEVRYRDGRVIVQKGRRGDAFFVLVEGAARVYAGVVPGGRAKARLRPGDFFGEMALLDGEPRSATVVAEGATTAFRLSRSAFARTVSNEPAIAIRIMAVLAARLRKGAANE